MTSQTCTARQDRNYLQTSLRNVCGEAPTTSLMVHHIHTGCSMTVYIGHNPIDSSSMHHCHSEHILGTADLFTSYRLAVHWSWGCWKHDGISISFNRLHPSWTCLLDIAFSISRVTRYHSVTHFLSQSPNVYTKPLQSISPNFMATKISRFTYSSLQLPPVAIAVAILTVLCYSPYNVGPGFISTSPATIRSSRLRGAMRREGASSPPVPPLDTGEEGEETNSYQRWVHSKYSGTIMPLIILVVVLWDTELVGL